MTGRAKGARGSMRVRFDHWTFDGESRELRRGERTVHLSPKAFDLLGALLEARPRALSKGDIRARLWPDVVVSESNLAGLVKEVRAALGDDAREPRFVRTVHRFGYAFSGAASDDRTPAPERVSRCRLAWGSREVDLREGDNVLGRGLEAVARIESSTVSRRHARIRVSGGAAVLEDLGSKNGTRVRGARVTSPVALADGDEICVGSVRLTFHALSADGSTETQAGSSSRA